MQWIGRKTFGILENWSPTRGGRLQGVSNVMDWPKNVWYFGKLVADERWLLTRGSQCSELAEKRLVF